ncbi:Biotin carboxylase [Actinokineospora alba]|uniref:Biotin carboxylase n=1 Tax=Actinokineospora alba TaxID=504798 RepID=A0A1H0NJF7_9PSEU|nr:ATP-grasp domain-containing protein [Actinokineospora alba]TDP68742.1 biotin carboxylase [Actinokineospora alba]SDH85694.1 Biotin carboxylase [Actinokineospora alba]SDO92803.1 Biotin carboxylase [Actinokineospora alba]
MEKYVLVGFNKAALEFLADRFPAGSVVVVEEPDVIAARRVDELIADNPCVGDLVGAPVQDEHDPAAVVAAVPRPEGVCAVVPANEYGVVAAAALAQAWGLPGATVGAATVLRDKVRLRECALAAGIPQPAFREVADDAGVKEFLATQAGEGVLKPANRQGSLGVRLLSPGDDVAEAWRRCVSEDAPNRRPSRELPTRYLVEQRLRGAEVSVEALVCNGSMVFVNVTAKDVLPGTRPVEMGHTVPAALPQDVVVELHELMRRLVTATGFATGVLHAEWMLAAGESPKLIECAGRMPGDSIDHLIDLAYGGSLLLDLITALSGRSPARPAQPLMASAIRFLECGTGEVVAIGDTGSVSAMDGVLEVEVSVGVGDEVGAVNHSWDRPGWIVATGPDSATAAATALAAASSVRIELR